VLSGWFSCNNCTWKAWNKMQFANCAAAAVLFTTLIANIWKFKSLFFCWGWDCS